MANKKAYVRYAKNKIVAGSLILADKAPKVGVWKEITTDLCCPINPPTNTLLEYPSDLYQTGQACVARGTAETLYISIPCYNNLQLGCELWSDAAGTIPVPDGDHKLQQIGQFFPIYATTVGGVVTNITTC